MIRQIAHVPPELERDRWPIGPSTGSCAAPQNHRPHHGEKRAPTYRGNTGPPPRELSDHPQRRRGLGLDIARFQQEEGLIVRGG